MKNAARGSNIILQQIRDLRVHTGVRQARCRTNKNTPESLQLNKLCARTRKLALHEVVKAQSFSLACLERGGLEPESLIPLSNSTSRISTAVTVTVSLITAIRSGTGPSPSPGLCKGGSKVLKHDESFVLLFVSEL